MAANVAVVETATELLAVVGEPTETLPPDVEDTVVVDESAADDEAAPGDAAPMAAATGSGSNDEDGGAANRAKNWTRAAFLPGGLILLIALAGMAAGRIGDLRRQAAAPDSGYSVATPLATSSGAAD